MARKFNGANGDKFTLFDDAAEYFQVAKNSSPSNGIRRNTNDFRNNDWAKSKSWSDTLHKFEHGDASGVAPSEKLLGEIEALLPPPTSRGEWQMDVAGGFPVVPAMLACQPLTMRRRARVESEAAPVAIVANLASIVSVNVEDMHKRGIAILALVRAIASRRPVELWAGVSMSHDNTGHGMYYRIPTAPMDLQRAAHWLSHPSATRAVAYTAIKELYPYLSNALPALRGDFAEHIAAGFPGMTDVLALPYLKARDPLLSDPVAWVRERASFLLDPAQAADAA